MVEGEPLAEHDAKVLDKKDYSFCYCPGVDDALTPLVLVFGWGNEWTLQSRARHQRATSPRGPLIFQVSLNRGCRAN